MMFIFVILGLLSCNELAVSGAVTPVFVQLGDDVLLEVKKPVVLTEETDFFWKFNTTYSIVKLPYESKEIIFKKYSGRAELSDQNHSLLLKNLQQADSGRYVALVAGERDRIIAEYKVIVQNPVSPVKLSVDSVSNSADSCNLTVTCSTQDRNISSTFGCDTQTCYQKGGEQSEDTTSGSSLRVYLLSDSIFCNHSNQVSWTKDLKKIWLLCSSTAGSTAVTPVFVQKGCDVLLEVKKPVVLTEEEDFFWKFNTSYSIVKLSYESKKIIFKRYSQRAELSYQNHSLLLKNLQQADSGRYVALVTGVTRDRKLAEYKVIVQNPVSPVNLSVDSVSNSADSCNLTVTCSTQDPDISSTFRCDTQTCNQMEGEQSEDTTSGSSLHVYLLNDSIFCNHSNQVSWTKDMKEIQHFCRLAGSESLSAGIPVCLVRTVVFSVGLVIMVSAVISVHLMEKLKKQK
ncbi:uncharacterized protein LOC121908208 [Thunnus maccoyii]|uniref:uncharacterized protein LOC121908208 n=1 Tax=Thunnus maccoyii TaxID=8240 RepID=UPI001C4C5325|nr:uncharacterized protein LOC121908208 [Thunnus maccoyii]